jgi:TPR repeat protein
MTNFFFVCFFKFLILFYDNIKKDGNLTQNLTKAFHLFLRAASVTDTNGDSLYNTGHCYWEGLGTKQDRSIAVQYFQRAANEFGHFGAIHKMGNAVLNGIGVEKNCQASLKYLVPAARHGSWGNIVRKGFNRYLAGDMQGALVRYLEGGEMGYEVALSNVGWILDQRKMTEREVLNLFPVEGSDSSGSDNGGAIINVDSRNGSDGVDDLKMDPLSKRLAFYFYKMANKMGATHNNLRLGDYHRYGYGGVAVDVKEAARYYRLASAAGVAEASFALAMLYSDGELTAMGTIPTKEDIRFKTFPGPAEDVLAIKYFDRCLEIDPSTEVKIAVELALGRLWARKEMNAWDEWWNHLSEGNWDEGVPLLTSSLENWLVSICFVILVVVLIILYVGKQVRENESMVVVDLDTPEVTDEEMVEDVVEGVIEEGFEDVVEDVIEAELPRVMTEDNGRTINTCNFAYNNAFKYGNDDGKSDDDGEKQQNEDDKRIEYMIQCHLKYLREQQAALRRFQKVEKTYIKKNTSALPQFCRPYHETKEKRKQEYQLTKQKFKAEALLRYNNRSQKKED